MPNWHFGMYFRRTCGVRLNKKNPSVKQTELAEQTRKSVRSIKRIIYSLKEKQYIRRVDGKRYGKWEVLI